MNVSDKTLNFQTNGSPVIVVLQAANAAAPAVSIPGQQLQQACNEPAAHVNRVAQRKPRRQNSATSASTCRSASKTSAHGSAPSTSTRRGASMSSEPRYREYSVIEVLDSDDEA
ncbi:hypothetical protein K474DRAFT_1773828, partial [Panus rudis PR-1116 ss-1]